MLWMFAAAYGRTWTVMGDGSGDFSNLSVAISAAASGDVLEVGPGTWEGPFSLGGKSLTVAAVGESTLTSTDLEAIWYLQEGDALNLQGFLLNNPGGRAILSMGGTLMAEQVRFEGLGSETENGMGAYLINTTTTLVECQFASNVGSYGAHIFAQGGSLNIEKSEFSQGQSDRGGIYLNGITASFSDTIFSDNISSYGAAVYAEGNSQISDTYGIWSTNTSTYYGGGLYQVDGEATFMGTQWQENIAYYNGGAIFTYANTRLKDNLFRENIDYYGGGAVYLGYNRLTITNSTAEENESIYGSGGFLYQVSGILQVSDTTLTRNVSFGRGGAIYGSAMTESSIEGSNFTSNETGSYQGGAVFLDSVATVILTDSQFLNNQSALEGGAVSLFAAGDATITDTFFINNMAGVNSMGGGCMGTRHKILS